MYDRQKTLNGSHTDVTVAVWSKTLGVIVRHEQASERVESSDCCCGLSEHAASMSSEAGVTNCRLSTAPAVVVIVAVGTVIASTSIPVVTVVVVVTVLRF